MRHGETEANVQRVLVGRADSPFTETGRQQPLQVARQLSDTSLSCIYTSPMARTRRTARLVKRELGDAVPLRTATPLAEIDAGDYTGLSFEEVRARVQGDVGLGEFSYPGGESWHDVQRRAIEFVAGLEERHEGQTVLLVTHAGVIAGLVAHHLDEPIERYIRTRFGHDFLGRLRVRDGAIVEYSRVVGTVDRWF